MVIHTVECCSRGTHDEKRRRDEGQWKNPHDAQLSLTLGGTLGVKQRKKKKKLQSKPSKYDKCFNNTKSFCINVQIINLILTEGKT